MPPKKRKRQPTQSQKQSQKVIVNIGSKSAPRKKSGRGRGGLPPPSYQHNLAPTFVTAPQVDYTPLLAMIQHHARPIVEQQPMPITQTPLSASVQASNAEQMAGEAAIRRAGPTAANFQQRPGDLELLRERLRERPIPEPVLGQQQRNTAFQAAYYTQQRQLREPRQQATEEASGTLRPPDPYVTEQLVSTKPDYAGGGTPVTQARRASRGRPKKGTQKAVAVGGAKEPVQARASTSQDITSMFKRQGL